MDPRLISSVLSFLHISLASFLPFSVSISPTRYSHSPSPATYSSSPPLLHLIPYPSSSPLRKCFLAPRRLQDYREEDFRDRGRIRSQVLASGCNDDNVESPRDGSPGPNDVGGRRKPQSFGLENRILVADEDGDERRTARRWGGNSRRVGEMVLTIFYNPSISQRFLLFLEYFS